MEFAKKQLVILGIVRNSLQKCSSGQPWIHERGQGSDRKLSFSLPCTCRFGFSGRYGRKIRDPISSSIYVSVGNHRHTNRNCLALRIQCVSIVRMPSLSKRKRKRKRKALSPRNGSRNSGMFACLCMFPGPKYTLWTQVVWNNGHHTTGKTACTEKILYSPCL